MIVAAGLALLLVIGLAVAYAAERRRSTDLEAQLAVAVDDQVALTGAAAVSRDRIVALEGQVGALEQELQRARQGRELASASNGRRAVNSAAGPRRARCGAARGSARSWARRSSDGTHVGRLVAVGADQRRPAS